MSIIVSSMIWKLYFDQLYFAPVRNQISIHIWYMLAYYRYNSRRMFPFMNRISEILKLQLNN